MTKDQKEQHPALVPPDRLQAAREKAKEKPTIDSGRTRFDVNAPLIEPPTEHLRRMTRETPVPCHMQTGWAYRAAGFQDEGSIEFRAWIFVPDIADGETEVAYYAERLHLHAAQPCAHENFLEGRQTGAEKCQDCDEMGLVYPSSSQEEIALARAAEAAEKKARKQGAA